MNIKNLFKKKKEDNNNQIEYIKKNIMTLAEEEFFIAAERVKDDKFLYDFIRSLGAGAIVFDRYYIGEVDGSLILKDLVKHLDEFDFTKAVAMVKIVATHIMLVLTMNQGNREMFNEIMPFPELKKAIFKQLFFEEQEIEAFNELEQFFPTPKMERYASALTYYFYKNVLKIENVFKLTIDEETSYFTGIEVGTQLVLFHGFMSALRAFNECLSDCAAGKY
jgi:hypothetical protein